MGSMFGPALVVLLLTVCGGAKADEWNKTDTALLGGAIGLLVIDWKQSREIARQTHWMPQECSDAEFRSLPIVIGNVNCRQEPIYHEMNPLLPSHPSVSDVDKYFAIAAIGTVGLTYVLPSNYRRMFLGGVVVLEALVVLRNHQVGVRVNF